MTTTAPPLRQVKTAPGSLPLIGHTFQLMRDPTKFLAHLADGGDDLVRIKIGPTEAFVPCRPESLQKVLKNDRVYDKGGVFYENARDIAGNGLVTCPYKDHRRQRRLMQSAFQRSQLEKYSESMREEIEDSASRWASGEAFDSFPTMFGMALRTVARTLYAVPVAEETVHRVEKSFEYVLSSLFRQMFLPQTLRRLPTPGNRRYRRELDFLHSTVQDLIDEYRRREPDEEPDDLLSALLTSVDDEDGSTLSDKEIHDQVITIMAAGTETVAATLTWIFYLMSTHPEIAEALYREIDDVLDGRQVEWSDLDKLELTNRVITETLRLYPPAWLFTRRTATETELSGVRIPAGSTIVYSPSAVQRDAGVYEAEDTFDPDRWTADRVTAKQRQGFVAFGTGARKCIGDIYARTEIAIGLATILGKWNVVCEPDHDVRQVVLATVYHPRQLKIRLEPRQK